MVVGELIEISSSDSDLEIEDVRDNIGSANGRSLPSWAFTRDASPGSRGQRGYDFEEFSISRN